MAYGTVNVGQASQEAVELATESKDGLMSAKDKKKLNEVSEGASSIKIANGTIVVT